MKYILYSFVILAFFSCCKPEKKDFAAIVSYWQNREVVFPQDISFISYTMKGEERKINIREGKYAILSYNDSIGCVSCKLQLHKWKKFIKTVDSLSHERVPFIFVFQSNTKDYLTRLLKSEGFEYPVFIDQKGSFNKLNNFPTDMQLQTFLLDSKKRVLAIGNPIHNPKIKELYLNIIQGKDTTPKKEEAQTEVRINTTSISLGDFAWQQEQKVILTLSNIGANPLVIHDVITSCGCMSVEYPKEPVRPSGDVKLEVTYKAEHPEYFDKTITVHCNVKEPLVKFRITGNAK